MPASTVQAVVSYNPDTVESNRCEAPCNQRYGGVSEYNINTSNHLELSRQPVGIPESPEAVCGFIKKQSR